MLAEDTWQALQWLKLKTGYPQSVVVDIALQEMYVREEDKRENK